MQFIKKYKLEIAAGLAIILLYFLLRLPNLTSIPVFADEAIYIRWAQVMQAEPTLRFLPLSDGKQPLFMWSIIPLFKIFSDPLFAGRMLSVIVGFASLIGIFLLGWRLFSSPRAGLALALLYAVSPYSLFFDRMALVDSMLTMFGIWTVYFGVLTVQTLRLDVAMLGGFALGGVLLTKSPALFFVALLPVTGLLRRWDSKDRVFQLIKIIGLWLVTLGIGYGFYNILRLGPNFHMIAIRNRDYVYPLAEVLAHPLHPFLANLRLFGEYAVLLLPLPVLLLVIAGVWMGYKKYLKQILFLSLWLIIPVFVGLFIARDFPARYVLYAIPSLFILAAITSEVFKKAWIKILLGLVLLTSLWIDIQLLTNPTQALFPQKEKSGYFQEWTSGTGIKEVAEYIKEQRTKNNKQNFVIGTEGFFGTLPNGLEIYLQGVPNVIIIGVGVWISDVHPSLLEAKKAGNRVFLVVNDTRFKGDAEKQGLALIASYPKQPRPDGTRESLLLFEVTDKAIIAPKLSQKSL